MKLNAVHVESYGIFNNFRLNGLKAGFNLIHGGNGSGKSTLARYIRNVLYGFKAEEVSASGSLDVLANHRDSKLFRNHASNHLSVKSIVNGLTSGNQDAQPVSIGAVGLDAFDCAFCVSGQDVGQRTANAARLLSSRFAVPVGKSVFGNEYEVAGFARQESELRSARASIDQRMSSARAERDSVLAEIERVDSGSRHRLASLDSEINEIVNRIGAMNLAAKREQVAVLDSEITALRIRVEQEHDRVEYVSRPYAASDSLVILYRRLDEVDNQIRRWRSVHADVQHQRVQLKDEMTIWNSMTVESNDHPYHRSREILRDIESRIEGAEETIHHFRSNQHSQNAEVVIENMQACFGKLRNDLYTLCDELGSQYKNIRQRAAAAELKRLRRCYHEIGENIESLIKHRLSILEDIRQADPAGAAAIARADHDFCSCAQHDGYLQARTRFVGELTTKTAKVVRVSDGSGAARLRELENLRIAQVRELVAMENEKNQLEALLAEKRSLREGLSIESTAALRDRLIQMDSEIRKLESEHATLSQNLEQCHVVNPIPANPIMMRACEVAERLTMGEIRRLWLNPAQTSVMSPVQVEQKSGKEIEFEYLGSGLQQQVLLSLCIAAVEQFRCEELEMPMILDDVFVNLDPELISRTYDVLADFGRRGQQILAMTSDRTVLELCRASSEPVLDLPDTSFTPSVPLWNPDRKSDEPIREPDFLTPFTTRQHARLPDFPVGYPQVKYPVAGASIDYSAMNFDASINEDVYTENYSPAPLVATARVESRVEVVENSIGESSGLESLRICSTDQLNRLSQGGITTVGQLLEINPHQIPEAFSSLGLSQSDIDNWQSVAWLLICVPVLDVEDAQLLGALGIHEPEQLESTHSQQLLDRISRYLNSGEGRRYSERGRSFSRDTINNWYDSLGRTRSRWRMPSGYSRRNRWRSSERSRWGDRRGARRANQHENRNEYADRDRGERQRGQRGQRGERISLSMNREGRSRRERSTRDDRLENAVNRFSRQSRTDSNRQSSDDQDSARSSSSTRSRSTRKNREVSSELKFYLDMSDQLEAAPSIGPKTAERFTKIGIKTVGEFLNQTAESMAPKINYKRITAEVIRTWQHQARLVCRIPNLRGHDSQLLVACGITEPEDLAQRSPSGLFSIIEPFAESKEGLKIIRGGKQPDLQEITDWINWAKEMRSLQAA